MAVNRCIDSVVVKCGNDAACSTQVVERSVRADVFCLK